MNKNNFFEECLKKETIFEGRIIKVNRDTVKLPNGNVSTREVVHHPGAVGIVPFKENNILMVRQYRYALLKETLEIPAGKLDRGEEPEACALRELREETGYSGDMHYLGSFNTSVGFSDEIIHLYSANNLKWDPLEADDDEFLGLTEISDVKAYEMVERGEMRDAKSALGIMLTRDMK
ncbi:MAG: NUDIX hydrolase [Eubacteriales bacterium]